MTANKLFAIVLAAGESSRFGSTKQLAEIDGLALAARAIRGAEALCGSRSVLVIGSEWPGVLRVCEPQQGFIVVNSEFRDGLATSMRAGVAAIEPVADAALIMLADQPLVTLDHLSVLKAAWLDAPGSIIASGYSGTIGPPVIFPHEDFAELKKLSGDQGAKPVLAANRDRVQVVSSEAAGIDIDRPSDLERI